MDLGSTSSSAPATRPTTVSRSASRSRSGRWPRTTPTRPSASCRHRRRNHSPPRRDLSVPSQNRETPGTAGGLATSRTYVYLESRFIVPAAHCAGVNTDSAPHAPRTAPDRRRRRVSTARRRRTGRAVARAGRLGVSRGTSHPDRSPGCRADDPVPELGCARGTSHPVRAPRRRTNDPVAVLARSCGACGPR